MMRRVIVLLLLITIASTAIAQDLGNTRPASIKNTPFVQYTPPATVRQGGDLIATAVPIPGLPFNSTGATLGYTDNYDEVCDYSGSTSPDVVYSFVPSYNMAIEVDLCGSDYDTKTYIYDAGLSLIACNDDYYFTADCGNYVSKIESAFLAAGETYFIVIDGYGGAAGNYVLAVSEYEVCTVTCELDAVPEGEPTMGYEYADAHNGGCNSPEFGSPFQVIDWTNDEDGVPPYDGYAWLCGVSGWYSTAVGDSRDTDWFSVTALNTGVMECTVESEQPCYLFKLSPTDCGTAAVEIQVDPVCGGPATLSFPVVAGEVVWLWVGPTTYTGPVPEFNYFMTVSNNTFNTVPNEDMSWSNVKTMFH
jgi:hypothetical protein